MRLRCGKACGKAHAGAARLQATYQGAVPCPYHSSCSHDGLLCPLRNHLLLQFCLQIATSLPCLRQKALQT